MAEQTVTDTARWLRAKAESYSRDARVLAEDGDTAMVVAYRAVAEALRECARLVVLPEVQIVHSPEDTAAMLEDHGPGCDGPLNCVCS